MAQGPSDTILVAIRILRIGGGLFSVGAFLLPPLKKEVMFLVWSVCLFV